MRKHQGAIMLGLAIAVIAIMLLSVSVGPVKISILEIAKMLLSQEWALQMKPGLAWQPTRKAEIAIAKIRIPRVIGTGYPQEPIYAMIY